MKTRDAEQTEPGPWLEPSRSGGRGAGSSGAAFPETGRDSESLTVSADVNYLEAPGHGVLPAGSPAQSTDGCCEVWLAGDSLEGTTADLREEEAGCVGSSVGPAEPPASGSLPSELGAPFLLRQV
ncbi:unnamed protein product [Rangifer tarandus platyrhynchus]|uniref:Uncharacterized protein n=1 Tax=Rangifer tarandus platyrhynchus TaxID=3082113 RepID=A0AC59ZST3_RANTA